MNVSPTLSGHMAPALPLSGLLDRILDLDITTSLTSGHLSILSGPLSPPLLTMTVSALLSEPP